MGDDEIRWLYRALLGREPETEDTIRAFASYYPSFADGRLAIMRSAEFRRIFTEIGRSESRKNAEELRSRVGQFADLRAPLTLPIPPKTDGMAALLTRISPPGSSPVRLCVGQTSLACASTLPEPLLLTWIRGTSGLDGKYTGLKLADAPRPSFLIPGDLRIVSLLCSQLNLSFDEIIWLGSPDAPFHHLIPDLLAENGTLVCSPDVDPLWLSRLGFERISNRFIAIYRKAAAGMPLSWEPASCAGGKRT